ncbi:MAG: hypothetical protein HY046_11595 [Acidobacteria bacterium]|nr:hypothetical protein [Acidobacteriota bacterium]
MVLVAIKTSAGDGYCECICGCYELVSLRDDETSKSYCPRCAKEHLELNKGIGIARLAPAKSESSSQPLTTNPEVPVGADPPGRLR